MDDLRAALRNAGVRWALFAYEVNMIGKMISAAAVVGALLAGSAFAQSAPASNQDGHHGWMHHGDPAAFHANMCSDRYARAAAKLAYVDAKLDLNASQKPLFEAWKTSVLGSAKAGEAVCLAHKPDMAHPPTALERAAMMHKMLEARLAAMDAAQPSLEAFYNSLSAAQKAEVDHMGPHRFGGDHGGWHHGPGDGHPQNG
jgi:hypothetical protein